MDRIILERDDCSSNAAAGRDFVSGLQLPKHGLPFFLAALLGHYENEVEDRKNKNEWRNSDPSGTAPGLPSDEAEYKHFKC